jgi:hypothetical protein
MQSALCSPRTGPDRASVGAFSWNDWSLTVGRIYWSCLILGLISVSPALGQYVAVIQACDRDLVKFCAPDRPDGFHLAKCTEAHFQDFTESCKAALVKIASLTAACGADIHEQCPGVRPNAGRILLCVKQHFASLSDSCKDAIGHAAERKLRTH